MRSVPTRVYLRTPIAYYGGKQQMLRHILPLIPEHEVYIEPFFGGGAVFWGKQPAKIEIINDVNAHVINFYKQLQGNYEQLKSLVDMTLHSRDTYKEALVIYHAPYLFSPLERAWAFWVTTNMGFSRQIGSWGYDRQGKQEVAMKNRREQFTDVYSDRLKCVQVECNDAVDVIFSRDCERAFIYCDPPYVGADQGHYGGYEQCHFDELLEALVYVKGKFLLSSYPNESLDYYVETHRWTKIEVDMALSASKKKGLRKTEVLVKNY